MLWKCFFGAIIEPFDCLLSRCLRNQQTLILTRCLNRLKERYTSPSDRRGVQKNYILALSDVWNLMLCFVHVEKSRKEKEITGKRSLFFTLGLWFVYLKGKELMLRTFLCLSTGGQWLRGTSADDWDWKCPDSPLTERSEMSWNDCRGLTLTLPPQSGQAEERARPLSPHWCPAQLPGSRGSITD